MAKQKYTVVALGFVINGKEVPIGETVNLEHSDFVKNKSHLQKAGSTDGANPNQASAKIKELTDQVARLKERVAELEKDLEDSQGSEELKNQVKQLESELKKANAELAKAK